MLVGCWSASNKPSFPLTNYPLFPLPPVCYSQPMTRLALTFLVGVFLFVVGGTGGAWAVTFKDGKVSKDNQVEEPAQNDERKSTGAGEI